MDRPLYLGLRRKFETVRQYVCMPESTPTASMHLEQAGLAAILQSNRLQVPPNQRNYSWTESQVQQLLDDLTRAQHDGETYFLGTVVTIAREDDVLEVVDGQQRLATTTLMLVAARDYLRSLDEEILVESIDNEFLTIIDRKKRERVPRIRLNVEDNEFFAALLTTGSEEPRPTPRRTSHELLLGAYQLALQHVDALVSSAAKTDHGDFVNEWVTFLHEQASVVLLRVHDDANAYKMFETLNDRGLRTSQADLVKNHLFGAAGSRIGEAQERWAYMRGALESLEDDDVTIDFLRYAIIAMTGYKREADLYSTVKTLTKTEKQAISLASDLDGLAGVYAATLNSDHERWNGYPQSARRAIQVLNLLDIRPLRALILSVANRFKLSEAAESFKFLSALGVRLLVASSTRSASVETPLAEAASKVHVGTIESVDELKADLLSITPSDAALIEAMSINKVGNAKLARYMLRSLELAYESDSEPYFIPNDEEVINLEHVLPKRPEDNWSEWTDDDRRAHVSRLGNQVLMRASDNSHLNSSSFADKKSSFAKSPYALTKQVSEEDTWTTSEVHERQVKLAQLAPAAWPV